MADATDTQVDDALATVRGIVALTLLGVFMLCAFLGGWQAAEGAPIGWGLVGLAVAALVSAYLVGSE